MSQEKKVSVEVEYNTNTVVWNIGMLQFIVSVLQCMEKGNLLILTFSLSFFRLKSINFLCDSKTPQHLI